METSLSNLSAAHVVVGLVIIPAVLIGSFLSRRFVIAMLGGLLFLSAIGVARDWRDVIIGSWLLPLQEARNAVFAGLSLLLLLGCSSLVAGSSLRRVPLIAWLVLGLGLFQGLGRIPHEGIESAFISILFSLATIIPLAVICPALIRDREDCRAMAQVVAVGVVLFISACAVQATLDPSRLTTGLQYRFLGVAANPQHVATFFAGATVFVAWRIWGESDRKRIPLWIGLFIGCGITIILTGSRTGIMMAIIGGAAIAYRRLGRSVLLVPTLAILGYLSVQVANVLGVDLPLARLSEGGDTRTDAWRSLMRDFLSSPLIGMGMTDVEKSENSFLFAGASFGFGMLALCLALAMAIIVQSIAIARAVRPYRNLRSTGDFVIAFNLAYLFGANFEGYMMSRNSAMMVMLLLSATIGRALLLAVREAETAGDRDLASMWGMDELIEGVDETDIDETETGFRQSDCVPSPIRHTAV